MSVRRCNPGLARFLVMPAKGTCARSPASRLPGLRRHLLMPERPVRGLPAAVLFEAARGTERNPARTSGARLPHKGLTLAAQIVASASRAVPHAPCCPPQAAATAR